MQPNHQEKDILPIKSVAVIGAAGQVGEAFIDALTSHGIPSVSGVVRREPHLQRMAAKYTSARFASSLESIISGEPELIILATPNPTDEVLAQTAQAIKQTGFSRMPTLLLLQNGIDVVPKALDAFKDIDMGIVRGCLFTPIARSDETGNLSYNRHKMKLSLAQIKGQNLRSVDRFCQAAGFKTEVCANYSQMELAKLFLNAIGATGTITGLSLADTFADERLFRLEVRAIRDRLNILHAAGFPVRNFISLGIPAGLIDLGFSRIPEPILENMRQKIGNLLGKDRGNIPSSAARRINQGIRTTETRYYHEPFINLGQAHNLTSPIDEAILSLAEKHESGEISLGSLSTKKRIALLQREITRVAPDLQIDTDPLGETVRNLVSDLFFSRSEFQVRGLENLETVREGQAIIAFGFHTGHMDPPAVRRALPVDLRTKLIIPAAADYWFEGNMDVLSILKALKTGKGRISLVRTLINPLFCRSIPFVRDITDLEGVEKSLIKSINQINQGYSIALAPEGTRSKRLVDQRPFEPGVALLVVKTGKPLVPIVLYGLEDAMPRGRLIPRLKNRKIICQIGKPLTIDTKDFAGKRSKDVREDITTRLREEIVRIYGELVQELGPTSITPMGTIFQRPGIVN